MADERELRASSDRMMTMLDRLAELEEAKRTLEVGSQRFVDAADEIERLARIVFRWSQVQRQLARESQHGGPPSAPLVNVEPRPLDRILAAWREAQLRLEAAQPGSPEAEAAASDVESLREEFRAAQAERA